MMPPNNLSLFATLSALLAVYSPSGVAATISDPCGKIMQYYDKSNNEIEADLKEKNQAILLDAKLFASECKELNDSDIPKSQSLEGKTIAVDSQIMKSSAERVLAAEERIKEANQQEALRQQLEDFKFAVGIGAIYLNGRPDIVSTTVDNNTLRVTAEEQYKLGLWLSTNSPGIDWPKLYTRFGYFMAVQLGGTSGSQLVNSFAAGISFRPISNNAAHSKGTTPLVFQFGYAITRINDFASGYTEGMTMQNSNQAIMKSTIGKGFTMIVSTAF